MQEKSRLLPRILFDFVGCALSLFLARQLLPFIEPRLHIEALSPPLADVAPVVVACFPVLVAILLISDLYSIPRHWTPFQILRGVFSSLLLTGALFFVVSLVVGGVVAQARKTVLSTGLLSLLVLWILRIRWPATYGRPGLKRRVLLVGAHTFAVRAIERYARDHHDEIEIVGIIDSFKGGSYFENLEIEHFGGREALAAVIENHAVDTLIVLNDQTEYSRDIIDLINGIGSVREVYVRAQIPLFMAQDIEILFVHELPLLKVFGRDETEPRSWMQRSFDQFAAAVGLVLTAPVLLLVALLIRLDSPGPIFYRQKRLGLHNRPFGIYKFRSMVVDAEKLSGAVLAQKNDPRVTRVGRFLRATRLDELPQLINILRGEMSLIGPRPERPEFQHIYEETIPWYPLRSLARPGITGLAQVSGDYHTSTQRKLLYDVSYLANMTPLLNLRILVATVVTVLTKRGH